MLCRKTQKLVEMHTGVGGNLCLEVRWCAISAGANPWAKPFTVRTGVKLPEVWKSQIRFSRLAQNVSNSLTITRRKHKSLFKVTIYSKNLFEYGKWHRGSSSLLLLNANTGSYLATVSLTMVLKSTLLSWARPTQRSLTCHSHLNTSYISSYRSVHLNWYCDTTPHAKHMYLLLITIISSNNCITNAV